MDQHQRFALLARHLAIIPQPLPRASNTVSHRESAASRRGQQTAATPGGDIFPAGRLKPK
jgi:hypothetical protein